MFTDIEGSTRLLRELGDDYADLLDEHHRLIRAALTAHRGREVDTQGDSFFALFADARDALACALEAQVGLLATQGPGRPIRVRMGARSPWSTDWGQSHVACLAAPTFEHANRDFWLVVQ